MYCTSAIQSKHHRDWMTLTLMISTDPKAWTRLVFSSCVEGGNWMHRRYICFLMWIPLVKMEIHFQCRRDRNRSPPALSWELKQALYIRGSCRRDIENAKSEVWINKLYWNSETLPFKTLNRVRWIQGMIRKSWLAYSTSHPAYRGHTEPAFTQLWRDCGKS